MGHPRRAISSWLTPTVGHQQFDFDSLTHSLTGPLLHCRLTSRGMRLMNQPIVSRIWPLALALLLAVGLAIMATTPPPPRPANDPPSDFSAGRAMADVRSIASSPHITGSPENARVRGYLLRRMAELGMETSTWTGALSGASVERRNKWTGRSDRSVPLVNVIGILPGKDRSEPAVLLMAHHDSVWGSPGAADDTAGVAATLEVVRALRQGQQPPRDLIVLFTDAEELGLTGARQFWATHPLREHVRVVINMEARGGGGRTTMFQTSRDNGEAISLYAQSVQQPATSSLAAFVYSVLPNDTDLTEVLKGPYLGYNFAFIGRPGLYHSPLATPDRLDQGALQDMGGQVLDLTRSLLYARDLPGESPDVVFFDLFGWTTLVYPTWAGWLVLFGAAAGFALIVRREGAGGLGEGAARMTGLLLLAAVLLFALNKLSIGLTPTNYYDRLAAIPRLEIIALLGSLAAALLVFGTKPIPAAAQVGAALPLLILAVAAQAFAPTAAYVLALPLALAALAGLIRVPLIRVLIAAPPLGYLIALGHQLMQGVGPGMPSIASLPLVLGVLLLLPVWPGLLRARSVAAGALIAAAAVALWVQLDAPAETRAVYSDHKK